MGGLQLMLNIAIWAGIGFYVAKLIILTMLFVSLDKSFPSWKLLKKSHTNKWFLIGIDVFFGYLGAHIFNTTNLGMVSIISFTVCSSFYICLCLLWHKIHTWWTAKKGEKKGETVNGNSDNTNVARTPTWFTT